jgi:hypothetical protein
MKSEKFSAESIERSAEKSFRDWNDLIAESKKMKTPPAEFKTAREWAGIYGKDVKTVERVFEDLKYESKMFFVRFNGRGLVEVRHWAQRRRRSR